MTAKRDWPTGPFNFGDIKFGALSGVGFDTLSEIPIKSRNRKDIELGNWEDGKPAGKIMTTEGDGSVLLSSSFVDTPNSSIINQTHSGLVGSSEGINKILDFLGTPLVFAALPPTSFDTNSALIIVGYPANFWITDQNGQTIKDKKGMVSITNHKSGNYKLNLLPRSNDTLIAVAQFLPNGQTLYKEYKFTGFGPKFKTIKLDLDHPREDVLE